MGYRAPKIASSWRVGSTLSALPAARPHEAARSADVLPIFFLQQVCDASEEEQEQHDPDAPRLALDLGGITDVLQEVDRVAHELFVLRGRETTGDSSDKRPSGVAFAILGLFFRVVLLLDGRLQIL